MMLSLAQANCASVLSASVRVTQAKKEKEKKDRGMPDMLCKEPRPHSSAVLPSHGLTTSRHCETGNRLFIICGLISSQSLSVPRHERWLDEHPL